MTEKNEQAERSDDDVRAEESEELTEESLENVSGGRLKARHGAPVKGTQVIILQPGDLSANGFEVQGEDDKQQLSS